MKKYNFSDEEKSLVAEAVKNLEKESCGEIVPVFVRRSSAYQEVGWLLSAVLAVSTMGLLMVLSYTWMIPTMSYLQSGTLIICAAAIGYLLPRIFPVVKRGLASEERMMEMVSLRAQEAFLQEQVFATKERVGILIFVSRLEHKVLVIGDKGINEKVSSDNWQEVVSLVTEGLKQKQIGEGLVKAINHCKELLLEKGFVRKDSDTNELSDDLRIRD